MPMPADHDPATVQWRKQQLVELANLRAEVEEALQRINQLAHRLTTNLNGGDRHGH